MSVSPTPPYGEDVEIAALKRRQFSYCNEFFAATMALVTEDNLFNGIIKLSPELCREAGLRLYNGPPEPPEDWVLANALDSMDISEDANAAKVHNASAAFKAQWLAQAEKKGEFPISFYFAVPINHVLSWGLHSKDYCTLHKVTREEFYFTPPPDPKEPKKKPDDILLYYLVPNVSLEAMHKDFQSAWLGKVDGRPLESMGFDLVPLTGARRYPGVPMDTTEVTVDTLQVRSTLSYMVAPKLSRAQLASLAPALSPTFPSCRDWDPQQAARERSLDQYIK